MLHQELELLGYLPRDRSTASLFLKYQQGRWRFCVAGSQAGRVETTMQPCFPREASGTRRRDWNTDVRLIQGLREQPLSYLLR